MQDIIGIAGIVVTIILAIISNFITWKLTKKSVKREKLNYSIEVFPILNLNDTPHELKVLFKEETLERPCLVSINIKNTGNKAVENPPIEIYCKESLLIPAYIEDVPDGYEEKWKFGVETKHRVKLKAEYINPNQEIKLRLFADLAEQEFPKIICPKKDLEFVNIEDELQNRIAKVLLKEDFQSGYRVSVNLLGTSKVRRIIREILDK